MSGRSPRTTALARPRHPAPTVAAAAVFVLVAVLPGTPSAGTRRPPTAATAELPLPAVLGQPDLGPGTAAPPIPSLAGLPDAAPAGPRGPGTFSAAVNLTGGAASPAALRAVQFALGQVGKPYVWGAEGPDTYDCSGLVQAAYGSAGVSVPRVARAQYRATAPVPVAAMLPGDLLFFGPDPTDVESIHHVGIYLGDGKMVHAPTAGDVVRVAPVWWAEFFGAARVVGAVAGAGGAVPIPVFRGVSASSPDPRPRSTAGRSGAGPGAAPPAAPPAGPGRPACPAPARPVPGPAGSVTGVVTWLVRGVLGPAPGDATAGVAPTAGATTAGAPCAPARESSRSGSAGLAGDAVRLTDGLGLG